MPPTTADAGVTAVSVLFLVPLVPVPLVAVNE